MPGSGRVPSRIYNGEYYVLVGQDGYYKRLFSDWELALDARQPGDYVLTRKLPKSGGGDPTGE